MKFVLYPLAAFGGLMLVSFAVSVVAGRVLRGLDAPPFDIPQPPPLDDADIDQFLHRLSAGFEASLTGKANR